MHEKILFYNAFFFSEKANFVASKTIYEVQKCFERKVKIPKLISTISTIYYEVRVNFITQESVRALNCMQ